MESSSCCIFNFKPKVRFFLYYFMKTTVFFLEFSIEIDFFLSFWKINRFSEHRIISSSRGLNRYLVKSCKNHCGRQNPKIIKIDY